jgi:hypothetical protein
MQPAALHHGYVLSFGGAVHSRLNPVDPSRLKPPGLVSTLETVMSVDILVFTSLCFHHTQLVPLHLGVAAAPPGFLPRKSAPSGRTLTRGSLVDVVLTVGRYKLGFRV